MQKTKYNVDYPLKQKCQRFLRTQTRPQHLMASEANTQKILEKKKKLATRKYELPMKDKTAGILKKDVPKKAEEHSKKEGWGRGRRMSQEKH